MELAKPYVHVPHFVWISGVIACPCSGEAQESGQLVSRGPQYNTVTITIYYIGYEAQRIELVIHWYP
jgi:hypothetical protein